MGKIIVVNLVNGANSIQCDAGVMALQVDDFVMVKTQHGLDLGRVISVEASELSRLDDWTKSQLIMVDRLATKQDMEMVCRQKEKEALDECKKMVDRLKLDMKAIAVRYSIEDNRYTIFFHAQEKVNFRSLVGKLNRRLQSRVEMRQIGPRDEARLIGGIGKCGLPLCCQTFLRQFSPVSIKMAKQQGLSLNPTKISGLCGRLLCCLVYENQEYVVAREKMPKIRQQVTTSFGKGTVTELNLLKETAMVRLIDSEMLHEVSLDQLDW
jgi:cell fate regulator YaaT (PSP1 superfamily)